jgi:hypothetical protein
MSNISNRIVELEKKVDRLQKYIVIKDGIWIKEYLDELDEFIISYESIDSVDLRLQLEFDNLMMCRASVQEDFLEYCRRAALQIEALTDWALRKEDNREPAQLPRKWKRVQDNKEDRWKAEYKREKYPNLNKIRSMDALELSYCVFSEGRYYQEDHIYKEFDFMKNVMKIRNIASHREEDADIKERMNREERRFYYNREKNYAKACSNIKSLRDNIISYFEEKDN